MAVDIKLLQYDVEMITESGARYDLTPYLQSLSWEEQEEGLAQRATMTLQNTKIKGELLSNIAKINCQIMIYANWGIGRQMVFQGTIWEWNYTSAINKDLTLTAYDPLIRLQRCKDVKYYSAGMDTKTIVSDICSTWGVSVSYQWDSIKHEKKSFRAVYVSDMIIQLLKEVKDKTGSKYILYYKNGSMQIVRWGTNSDIYSFKFDNVISTHDRLTMDKLVTKVKIIGKEDNKGRTPIEAVVNGRLEFGVFQDILIRDSDKSISEAQKEAQAIIKENGKPDEQIQISAPDLPFLRKGDKVKVDAGNLTGYFLTSGVTHDATNRLMQMELSRS